MYDSLMTLLFFPDWTNGLPSDFLILHFFVGAVIFPFNMIHAKARKIDSQNPQEAANGYKNNDNTTFFGYEEINQISIKDHKGITLLMIIALSTAIDLKIFSPTEPLGILILFLGLIFSGMIFYIIYAVSTNKESLEDKKMRTTKESLQKEKIEKLFPKKK